MVGRPTVEQAVHCGVGVCMGNPCIFNLKKVSIERKQEEREKREEGFYRELKPSL